MAKGKNLQPSEIESLLQQLGSELTAQGLTSVRVMILGGTYILLRIGNRAPTQVLTIKL